MTKHIQQKLLIIVLIAWLVTMFAVPAFCQSEKLHAKTDNAIFETVRTMVFLNRKKQGAANTSELVEFRGSYIMTTFKDQTKKLYLDSKWRDIYYAKGDKMISLEADAIDDGGFECLISLRYDKKLKVYQFFIEYRNVSFIHSMRPTNETMWDTWDEWSTYDDKAIPENPEYSEEQISTFLNTFGFLFGDFVSLSWLN